MIQTVKIIGAGSIGNHLANAARRLDLAVTLCDKDPAALVRAEQEIYPGRYGAWDPAIKLGLVGDTESGEGADMTAHDLVIVGTPPDSHVKLAMQALEENPVAILIEKPLSTPDLEGLTELKSQADRQGVRVFVGYDHVVSSALGILETEASRADFGSLVTLDVDFREHWRGIFSAHPWLAGPKDTYLGYWARGGGACGEHSHAINMWQHIAHLCGKGRIQTVSAELEYIQDGPCEYDRICLLQVKTEGGMCGRIAQDVVTLPVRKEAYMQFENGAVRWQCGGDPAGDLVTSGTFAEEAEVTLLEKTRPDDFIAELNHLLDVIESGGESPISLDRGLDTMLVIAAAHLSAIEGRVVNIDYRKGPVQQALTLI